MEAALGGQEYKLVADTLFLAVSYLDRYLSLRVVPRARLQLVGVTCMLLAAKYEEIYAPQVPARALAAACPFYSECGDGGVPLFYINHGCRPPISCKQRMRFDPATGYGWWHCCRAWLVSASSQ